MHLALPRVAQQQLIMLRGCMHDSAHSSTGMFCELGTSREAGQCACHTSMLLRGECMQSANGVMVTHGPM